MTVTNKISFDLLNRGVMPRIDAVQGDANTRVIEISLYSGGAEFTGALSGALAYRKPDKTSGLYDKLPNGKNAVNISGSTAAVTLAPQVLTCPGSVMAALVLNDADLNQVATFPFIIEVAPNPAAGKTVSNDYYKYSTMADISAAMESFMAQAEAEQAAFLETAAESLASIRQVIDDGEDAPPIVCEAAGGVIAVNGSSSRLLRELTLYGRTTQDGTPSPDAPVALASAGDSGSVGVTVAGKNLFPVVPAAVEGVTLSICEDYFVLNGTATKSALFYARIGSLPAGTYTICANNPVHNNLLHALCDIYSEETGQTLVANDGAVNSNKAAAIEKANDWWARIRVQEGVTYNNYIIKPQLECGTKATEYEPNKPAQTLRVPAPNGLPGIPVTSGGNYTDESGQQWCCDEIDLTRGVYVRRIGKYTVTGGEDWKLNGTYSQGKRFDWSFSGSGVPAAGVLTAVSTHYPSAKVVNVKGVWVLVGVNYFGLRFLWDYETVDELKAFLAAQYAAGTPVEVLYILRDPVETPLDAGTLAAYAALHSNKPTTTVYNDAGAELKLSYAADTKLYIDNKIAALSAAILNA